MNEWGTPMPSPKGNAKSYMMGMENDVTPIRVKEFVDDIPAEFRYHACPRCDGTVYSGPNVRSFYCLVCGWAQKCSKCFGDVGTSGAMNSTSTGTYCKSCGQSYRGIISDKYTRR